MAQRGSPGIHAGMSPASGTSTRPAGGASRTGPQQRPSRDLRCCFLKANRRHKYHCSAFKSALGSPPPFSRPRGGALAQGWPAWMPAKPRWATEGPSGRALRKRTGTREPSASAKGQCWGGDPKAGSKAEPHRSQPPTILAIKDINPVYPMIYSCAHL